MVTAVLLPHKFSVAASKIFCNLEPQNNVWKHLILEIINSSSSFDCLCVPQTAAAKNLVINYNSFFCSTTLDVHVFPSSSGGHKQISGRTYMSQHSEKYQKWYTKSERKNYNSFQLFGGFSMESHVRMTSTTGPRRSKTMGARTEKLLKNCFISKNRENCTQQLNYNQKSFVVESLCFLARHSNRNENERKNSKRKRKAELTLNRESKNFLRSWFCDYLFRSFRNSCCFLGY